MVLSDLVKTLLKKRGIIDTDAIDAFLAPDYEKHTHDPNLLAGMDRAVHRFLSAIDRNERIAIYADFDCDGIPGAAVFSDFFQKVGFENFEVYLPHRDREGYGLHREAVDSLATRSVSLMVTVDVGTNALEVVAHAKERGIDTIVTDHHEVTSLPRDAIAVLNPKLGSYPFADLCGAAVAFKLVQAVIREGKRRSIDRFLAISDGWEKWLLDLVAIATIADMVPLIGENRVLAYWGLQVLRKSPRQGIAALCSALRLRRAELSEEDIGFSIAPRINAASRMDEPDLGFKLLTTCDRDEAIRLAAHLEALNKSRKGVVGGMVREARKRVQERYTENDRVVVLGNPEWKPALLGLAANSIMGDRGGVVCMWGRDARGRIKGSCRSDGSISVVELCSKAPESFEEFGGHVASGGFTARAEAIHTLPEVLARAALEIEAREVARSSEFDVHVTLREIAPGLFSDITQLAPFGIGNPKPIFRIGNTHARAVRRFGKEQNHVEVSLVCRDSGTEMRAFDFFRSPDDFTYAVRPDSAATVLATIERDSYRGGLALRLVDIIAP